MPLAQRLLLLLLRCSVAPLRLLLKSLGPLLFGLLLAQQVLRGLVKVCGFLFDFYEKPKW